MSTTTHGWYGRDRDWIEGADLTAVQNGQYPEVPRVKRSLRDPYDNWWDPQERRNYGEPIHEDNDILGVFSTEPYTHFTTSWGWVLMGTFVGTVLTLCGAVAVYYPDKPSVPRTFPGGLETELGGPGALSVCAHVETGTEYH